MLLVCHIQAASNAAMSCLRRIIELLLAATDSNSSQISLGDDFYNTELLSGRQIRLRLSTFIGAHLRRYVD